MHKARRFIARIGLAVVVSLMAVGTSACSTFQQGAQAVHDAPTPAAKLVALAQAVDSQCAIGAPFLLSLKAAQTDVDSLALLDTIQTKAGQVCTVAAAIAHPVAGVDTPTLNVALIRTFASAQVPKLIVLVRDSKLEPKDKAAATLALSGAQLILLDQTRGL